MKKVSKRLLATFLAVILVFGAAPLGAFVGIELPNFASVFVKRAEAATNGTCGDNLTWTFDESTGELVINGAGEMYNWSYDEKAPWHEYSLSIKAVTISDSVTSIGDYAFSDCSSLVGINIPNGVTSIGDSAFIRCTSLASIIIPDGITSIDDYVFYECTNLASIAIPDSVTRIGRFAFYDCDSLTSIIIPDSVTIIDGYAFYCCTNLASINIPNGVITLGESAFDSCTSLTSINIPNGVTSIERQTFSGCTSLASITIPNSVTSIGNFAFNSCKSLTSITIPDNVTSLGESAFSSCSSLASITIPNSVTSIGNYAFSSCSSLASITIPDGITNIGYSAFSYTKVYYNTSAWINDAFYIGNYLLEARDTISGECSIKPGTVCIADNAFEDCYNLTGITIPDSVTSIGDSAFSGCFRLESVTIGNGVRSIGESAFGSCSSLASIAIPDGVTSLGDFAFGGCTSLASITIPDSVTSIGESAFSGCTGLASITLSDGVASIGESAFCRCTSLTSITIPPSVAVINNYTFSGCENLTDVVISNGVTTIGAYVFEDCDKLKTLNIPASVTDIRYDAFEYCNNLETINVDSANKSYSNDEYGVLFNKDKTVLVKYPRGNRRESYSIPDGVIGIDEYAFRRCYYLTDLQIPDSVMYISEVAFEKSTIYENLDNWENGVLYISNHLIKANESLKGVYQVREGTKSIAANAFVGCSGLTGVILPEGLTSIDWGAFGFCVNLRCLVIPYGVTNISKMAFFNCAAMEYIHVPSSVTSIGTDCIISDSMKAELLEELKTYSEEELTSLGFTKESVEAFSSTTLICSDSADAYAKTYAVQNGNEFAVCDGHGGEIPDTSERLWLCSGICGENLTYKLYADGELVISGTGDMYDWDDETPWYNYKQFIKTVTVDNGVTSIGSYAFTECYYLEKITISDSVKSIGEIAFYCCFRLDSVAIPDSVINIGENAFFNCMAMEYIHIPSSVTTIGNNVIMPDDDKAEIKTSFDSCAEDELVEYAQIGITKESVANWTTTTLICSDSEDAYAKTFAEENGNQFAVCDGHEGETSDLIIGTCGDNLTWTFNESTGELVISGTGDMYDYNSFSPWSDYKQSIKTVTIDDGVTSIGDDAFYQHDCIENIAIGNNVTHIGDHAFYMSWITSIELPDSLVSIGDYAFAVTSLSNVTIPDNVTSIGNNAFYECDGLETVTIGDSVTSIGDCAFRSCNKLTSLTIPATVVSIGEKVFYFCISLTSITVDLANTAYSSDDYGVLFNKDKTELIQYPTGNTRTEYVIPDGVTIIGDDAFDYCRKLTSITIPDGVTSIGTGAFSECANLECIKLPDSLKKIGDGAFSACRKLRNVIIPESVTSIGRMAFYSCVALDYIHIPSGVTIIAETIISSDAEKAGLIERIREMLDTSDEEDLAYFAEMGITKEMAENYLPTTVVCSDSENSAAKTFAEENGNEFAVCDGHGDAETPEEPSTKPEEPTTKPEEPSTQPEEPSTKPSEPKPDDKVVIKPSVDEIKYGDAIVLHVDPAMIPDGGYVEWNASNESFTYEVSDNGKACKAKPAQSGETVFTATIYDAEGNAVGYDTQILTAKAGFFQKIIAFFKSLFGLNKIYDEIL